MVLYVYHGQDDSASAATLVLHPSEIVDGLVAEVESLGGHFHALVATTAINNLVGLVELPGVDAAVGLTLLERSRGRSVSLTPAVPIGDFGTVIDSLAPLLTTSTGDGADESGESRQS
jgi:uncharacterized protein with GYD domain